MAVVKTGNNLCASFFFFKYSRSRNRYNKNVLFLEKKLHLGIFMCLDFTVTLNLWKAVHIVPICIMIDYFRALYHWRTVHCTWHYIMMVLLYNLISGKHRCRNRGVDTCTMPWTMRGVGDFIPHCFSFIIDLRMNETLAGS